MGLRRGELGPRRHLQTLRRRQWAGDDRRADDRVHQLPLVVGFEPVHRRKLWGWGEDRSWDAKSSWTCVPVLEEREGFYDPLVARSRDWSVRPSADRTQRWHVRLLR